MATTRPVTFVGTWSQARGADDQVVWTGGNSQQLEPRDANRRSETKQSESQQSLQRALNTLHAVRQRYETGRNAHPDPWSYRVNVVVEHSDIAWITAAIEVVAKAIAASRAEPAGSATRDSAQKTS